MGKKKSKKNSLNKFMKRNRGLLGTIAGTAAGIALASVFRTERIQQLINRGDLPSNDSDAKRINEKTKNSYKTAKSESERANPTTT
jgi:hypothetical protein